MVRDGRVIVKGAHPYVAWGGGNGSGWESGGNAGLKEGVTDVGLHALVSAGCGAQLTSLTLSCGCSYFVILVCGVCEWEMDSCVLDALLL